MLWQLLQHVGGYYVDHVVRHAKETSGLFAFVLGLLAWLYLGAQMTLLAAEINVVRARRLWPRSFFSDPLLEADRRALTSAAEVEERVEEENVEVSFDEPSRPAGLDPAPWRPVARASCGARQLHPRSGACTRQRYLRTQRQRAILTTLS